MNRQHLFIRPGALAPGAFQRNRPAIIRWITIDRSSSAVALTFVPVAFDHPLFVLFSSGDLAVYERVLADYGKPA